MARKPRVMEAIEPHVCVDAKGDVWTIRAGERLMSRHPAVLQNPQYFAESSREDVTQPRLLPDEPEPQPPSQPEPRVRAKCYMRLRGIALPGGLAAAGMTLIHEGDLVPRSHPAVKAQPENFEPVP
jgi:hypothetical protein